MDNMGFCYNGDNIKYNDLQDEFFLPLPKCSEITFHSFELDSNLYVVYPRHSEYCGSGGCHIYLIKKIGGEYIEVDDVWGDLNVKKSMVSWGTFYYLKTDKSSKPHKELECMFVVKKDQFIEKKTTLIISN